MANVSAYAQKLTLDWLLGGAAATQPAQRWIALSLGTPTSVTGSEVQANSGYLRLTGSFGAANSPAGSASLNVAQTFGPFSSSAALQGVMLWDTASINSGNMLFYNTLQTARTVLSGDTVYFATGGLTCTMA